MTENYYTQADYGTILTIMSDRHGMMCFIIDDDDVEKVKQYKWCIMRCKQSGNGIDKYYARSTTDKLLLHRFVTNAPQGQLVDHINNNTFDNRKCNLRLCDRSINGRNRLRKTPRKTPQSITGVFYNKNVNKWYAYIQIHNQRYSLGYFKEEQDAINARLEAEVKYGYSTEIETNQNNN